MKHPPARALNYLGLLFIALLFIAPPPLHAGR